MKNKNYAFIGQMLPPQYAESKEFPLVGSGGRNAMAGLVFYSEDFKKCWFWGKPIRINVAPTEGLHNVHLVFLKPKVVR